MPFDGIVAHAVAEDLHRLLVGGRIGKIQQPNRETVFAQVRAGGENHRLLLCCAGHEARVQLTRSEDRDFPATPPMFCMLLRKHLTGGILRRITCPERERVVILEVETEDELGDRSLKKLVIEVMGRHSNIILLNRDDVILDAARHVDAEISRVREILPARHYEAPPAQEKLDPLAPDTAARVAVQLTTTDKKLSGMLLAQIRGFSPILCREVCHLAGLDEDRTATSLQPEERMRVTAVLETLRQRILSHDYAPCTITDPLSGRALDFHVLPLTAAGNPTLHATVGDAMDAFFGARDRRAKLANRRAELAKTVNNNLSKVQKKLTQQLSILSQNADFDRLRHFGELLTGNIHALSEGMEAAVVVDWLSETGATIRIPLDPNLTPQRNAQRYFRRYQKAKSACRYAESQLDGLRSESNYLESLLYGIENADNPGDFEEIREEMRSQGYLKAPVRKLGKGGRPKPVARGGNPAPAEPLEILSQDGFPILIGRNNRQNDRLTLKLARAEDLWFHIKHFSGSHVVIKTAGNPVPAATIEEAAAYAAWYSKARNSTKAEVDYTFIRHVKKPSGGKPGMVIYVQYQTVVIAPREPASNRRPTV